MDTPWLISFHRTITCTSWQLQKQSSGPGSLIIDQLWTNTFPTANPSSVDQSLCIFSKWASLILEQRILQLQSFQRPSFSRQMLWCIRVKNGIGRQAPMIAKNCTLNYSPRTDLPNQVVAGPRSTWPPQRPSGFGHHPIEIASLLCSLTVLAVINCWKLISWLTNQSPIKENNLSLNKWKIKGAWRLLRMYTKATCRR